MKSDTHLGPIAAQPPLLTEGLFGSSGARGVFKGEMNGVWVLLVFSWFSPRLPFRFLYGTFPIVFFIFAFLNFASSF